MTKTSIKNAVLFITGASRKNGIGQALVKEAIKRGAKKVYVSARKEAELDHLQSEKVVCLQLDVTSVKSIEHAASLATDTTILINNAGYCGFSGCTHGFNDEHAYQEFAVNCFGPLHLMNAFSNTLIENKKSAIVNICSIGAFMPFAPAATYSASKAALYSLTQSARIEMMPHGIPVFGVYPGPVDTDMAKELPVTKASTTTVAKVIFDAMELGIEDITPDPLSEAFQSYLKKDPKALEAVKSEFHHAKR